MNKEKNKTNIIFAAFIMLALSLSVFTALGFAQGACFPGTGCRGTSEICDTQTCIDASGRTETSFLNCKPTGLTTAVCPDGTPVSCQNTCEEGVGGAMTKQCNVNQNCKTNQKTKPTVILLFATFLKRNIEINITPAKISVPAPEEKTYEVTTRNPNSFDLTFTTSVIGPPGWRIVVPSQVALRAGETRKFNMVVTPNVNLTFVTQTVRLNNGTTATFLVQNTTGLFNISVGLFEPRFRVIGIASAQYEILPGNFPDVSVTPLRSTGPPGRTQIFEIVIKNKDIIGFPPTLFVLSALTPFGWSASLSDPTIVVNADQTSTVTLTVVPNLTASEGANPMILSVRSQTADIPFFITHTITLCGDNVCQIGEETACSSDCPSSPFRCTGPNKRCEIEIDYGVDFNATLTQPFTGYYVCSRNATVSDCTQAFETRDCGVDKPCICGDIRQTSCQTRCVDTKGVYYLAAQTASGFIRSANYSFSCPFVNLPGIVQTRENITESRINFEKGKDVLDERIRIASTAEERGQFLACADALGTIIRNLTKYGNYLDAVIDFPGKKNTTEARRQLTITKNLASGMFNNYCRKSLSGALQIENVTISRSFELGTFIDAVVQTKNAGNIDYYGYAECDFTNPGQATTKARGACIPIKTGEQRNFAVRGNASAEGRWQFQCRIVGSLQSDCSSEVHDETEPGFFDVYSKDIYVSSVRAEIVSNSVICSVTASRDANCIGCSIDGESCTKIGSQQGVTGFKCPTKGGTHNVTGFVFDSPACIAIEPKAKYIAVRVPGCGDGTLDRTETCDPAYRGEQCAQTGFECSGKKYGSRPSTGLCTSSCTCQQQQMAFSCVKDQCAAECSDAETQTQEIEKDGSVVTCIQRCTSSCTWSECTAPGFIQDPVTGESVFRTVMQFDPIRASGTANPGTAVDYSGILRNTGDETDTFTFRIESGNAAIIIDNAAKSTVELLPNGSAGIILKVTPIERKPGDVNTLNISIESQKTSQKESALFMTIISDIANRPPQIRSVSHAPDSVDEGQTVRFHATFTDPNSDVIAEAFVCPDIECRNVLCRLLGSGSEFTCTYSTISSGLQEYFVFARDSRDASATSDARLFRVGKSLVDAQEPILTTPGKTEGDSPLFAALVIAIIIAAVVVIWAKRNAILDRLGI